MKEFFLRIVQSLERISSMNDHYYSKAVSILETMAGIKSCLIIMDLHMDGLILQMFQTFLTSIQSRPSAAVFSHMVAIMTTVMEEHDEEGIPVDLLSTLLTSVKKERKDDSPISWAMGVQILQKSARHVQPFLTNLVQSLEIDLSDYAEIVTSICQNAAQEENMLDQGLASGSAGPNDQLVDRPSMSLENNSTGRDMGNKVSSEQSSLKILQFGNHITELMLTDNATRERGDKTVKDENSLKDPNSVPTEEKKTADLKNISEAENLNVTLPEEKNRDAQDVDHDISSEQNASETLQFGSQTAKSPLANNVTSRRDVSPLKDNNSLKETASGVIEVQEAIGLEAISEAENVNVNNAIPQEKNDGLKVPEKRERKPTSKFKLEEGYCFAGRTCEIRYLESSCSWKSHKRRTNRLSDRKNNAVSFGNISLRDKKPHRKRTSKMKGIIVNQPDPEQKQLSLPLRLLCGKQSRGKLAIPANCDQDLAPEMLPQFDVLPASHSTNQPASESEYKGKSSSSNEEASRMPYGEKLVGCKIKVWWPLDQLYYEGTVDSFDLSTMMHKVIYDDGDEETLNLMGEDWQLVKDALSLDGQEKVQGPASADQNLFC